MSRFRIRQSVAALLTGLAMAACTSVDVVRLTNQTFPPKPSLAEVEVLTATPSRAYIQLAELHIHQSTLRLEDMQNKILRKAAALGADAVVFSKPHQETLRRVAYQPMYGPMYAPWGYGVYGYPGWGYGGWAGGPWGYGPFGPGGMYSQAVPYDISVRSLKGLAIRYGNGKGPTG